MQKLKKHSHFTVSWETWHKCFGHISYQSLQSLIKNKIVDGFNPDLKSPMPDCSTCAAAKMTHRPFPKTATRTTKLGQLMHIDLWGKYQIQINTRTSILYFICGQLFTIRHSEVPQSQK